MLLDAHREPTPFLSLTVGHTKLVSIGEQIQEFRRQGKEIWIDTTRAGEHSYWVGDDEGSFTRGFDNKRFRGIHPEPDSFVGHSLKIRSKDAPLPFPTFDFSSAQVSRMFGEQYLERVKLVPLTRTEIAYLNSGSAALVPDQDKIRRLKTLNGVEYHRQIKVNIKVLVFKQDTTIRQFMEAGGIDPEKWVFVNKLDW